MRKLKDCFHMILTAVICFAVNLFSRKPDNSAKENKVFLSCMKKSRNSVPLQYEKCGTETGKGSGSLSCSPGDFLKKVFFWLQGPGDRKRYPDNADFTVCAYAHSRAPDACTGSDNIVHGSFLKVAA